MIEWIKDKVSFVVGAIIVLTTAYILGRKGKENETNKDLVNIAKKSKHNMSFNELVKRMQEYNDK